MEQFELSVIENFKTIPFTLNETPASLHHGDAGSPAELKPIKSSLPEVSKTLSKSIKKIYTSAIDGVRTAKPITPLHYSGAWNMDALKNYADVFSINIPKSNLIMHYKYYRK